MIRRAGSCVLALAVLAVLPPAIVSGQAPTPAPQDDYIIRSTVNNLGDYLYVRVPSTNDYGFALVLRRANGTETTILRSGSPTSGTISLPGTVPRSNVYVEGFGRYFDLNDNLLAAVRIGVAGTQDGADDGWDLSVPDDTKLGQGIITVNSSGTINKIVLDRDMIAGEAVGTMTTHNGYPVPSNEGLSPWPGLNNAGQVAFGETEVRYSSYDDQGGYSHSDDSGYRLIRYTPPSTYDVLLRRGDAIFTSFFVANDGSDDNAANTLNSAGQVLTRAQISTSMPPSTTTPHTTLDSLIILNGPGNLTEVAREGNAATYSVEEAEMGVLNDGGQVLYKGTDVWAACGAPATMPHEHLVRFTPPSTYTLVAHSGDDVPGTVAGGPVLQGFGVKYAMNSLGHAAFVAGIELDASNPGQSPGGPDYCGYPPICAQDQILFFWNGTSLQPIARTTTLDGTDCAGIASGLGGFAFDWFANFVHLNDNDTIVFFAENGLCNYSGGRGQEGSGWFSWTSATGLQKVVAEGDAAQGGVITNLDPKPGQDKQRMLSNTNAFAISAAIDGPVGSGQDDEDVPMSFIPAVIGQQATAEQIPLLGSWAAALLTLLLVGAGLALLRRTAAA